MIKVFKDAGKLLKKLDIFGYPISLSSDRRTVHNTKIGGFTSCLILSFFLTVGIISFYELFSLQLMESSSSTVNLGAQLGSLSLTTDIFMVAITTNVNQVNNWTNPFLNVSLSQNTKARVNDTTVVYSNKINLTLCTPEHFRGLEDQFQSLGLNSALCPELGSNLTIEGGFVENIFTYLKLEFYPCSDPTICQTAQAFSDLIDNNSRFAVDFYIINNDVEMQNLQNPISSQIYSDMHFLISPLEPSYTTADIFLSELKIQTDYSYFPSLTNNQNLISTYTYKKEIQEQTIFTYDQGAYADFYFRKSQISYQNQRDIGKFLEILSYLGGIWSTCYIVVLILLRIYGRKDFINKLANKLYDYPSEKKKKILVSQKSTDKEQTNGLESKEKIINKIEDHLSYDRKLKIGFVTMIKYIFSPLFICFKKNDKLILMRKSEENIKKDLDIYTILRKINELDAMRKVLFTEDQQLLLKFCPKRSVDLNKKMMQSVEVPKIRKRSKINFLEREIQFDNLGIYQKLISAWNNLKASHEQSGINNRIIKLFDEELRTIFSMNNMEEQNSRLSLPAHIGSTLENFEEIEEKSRNHEIELENYNTNVRILTK